MTIVRRSLVEGDGSVRRATLDVVVGGEEALVSLALREGSVVAVCSCGGAPGCAHAAAALHWLEGSPERASLPPAGTVLPSTTSDAGGTRTPAGSIEPGRAVLPVQRSHALAAALDDLATVVVRAGVDAAAGTPSLDESLRRLVAAAPAPLPIAIGRVVGRLREALAARDAEVTARLCTGLGRLADALRDGDVTIPTAWLGVAGAAALEGRSVPPGDSRLVDVRLLEVAREWVTTLDRAGLERRYLADPRTGALYREERLRGAPAPSLGPCPRSLAISLAEIEPGPAPRRVRLLQYEVALAPEPLVYTELATHAAGRFEPLLAQFREELAVFPALAEPFVLVAPQSLERTRAGADLVDAEGVRLALAGEPRAVTAALLAFAADDVPLLVAGRLVTAEGALALAPLSVVVGTHEAPALRRLA
jgi:hypothetical protein